MHIQERKNILFRIIATCILVLSLSIDAYGIYKIATFRPEAIVLDIIAIGATIIFCIFEIIVILRGGKKDSNLYKIAFDEKDRVNSVAFVAVLIGTSIGLALTILSIVVYFLKCR